MILDEPKSIQKLDISKSSEVMDRFPQQCEEAIKKARKFAEKLEIEKPERVSVCGMGASGIIGDLLAGIFRDRDIRVFKGYDLPKYVGSKDLVLVISYSGNTEETLSLFKQAVKKGLKTIAITGGGEIERLCVKHSLDYIKIPKYVQARFSVGNLLFPAIIILEKAKFINKQNLDLVLKNLRETHEEICLKKPLKENPAKRLALKLAGSIPVVYGFGMYEPVAFRTRTEFNESSKVPSFHEVLPEMNHNSLLGWEQGGSMSRMFSAIFIRDDKESERIRSRIEFTKKILRKHVKCIVEVWSMYPYGLSRAISTMYVLDFVALYLGLLRGKDPGEQALLFKLKSVLKKE